MDRKEILRAQLEVLAEEHGRDKLIDNLIISMGGKAAREDEVIALLVSLNKAIATVAGTLAMDHIIAHGGYDCAERIIGATADHVAGVTREFINGACNHIGIQPPDEYSSVNADLVKEMLKEFEGEGHG